MTELMFRTAYNHELPKEQREQPHGEEVEMWHREVIDKEGNTKLIQDVAVNVWEKIQTMRDECDIKKILERAMGNPEYLNQVEKTYMDCSNMPSTWAEAQSNLHQVQQDFDKLPKEIRQKFDNDYRKYIAGFGTDKWLDDTGIKAMWERKEMQRKAKEEQEARYAKAIENLANMRPQGTSEGGEQ